MPCSRQIALSRAANSRVSLKNQQALHGVRRVETLPFRIWVGWTSERPEVGRAGQSLWASVRTEETTRCRAANDRNRNRCFPH